MRRIAAMTLALAAAALPAHAATPASGLLSSDAETVSWTGRTWTTSDVPEPDTFELTIALPAGYWAANDGGVEVAIRWESEYNVLDLYVIDESGTTVASATGFPTSAESLILREPANGSYRVVVVPTGIQEDTGYDGIAEVELDTTRTGPLLPDLVALAPAGLRIAAGAYSLAKVDEHSELGGCYPDEVADDPALTRCLRFDAGVANLGHGPFELRLDLATAAAPVVYQDVYDAAGERTTTAAGSYTFHATHGHVHYEGFASYALHHVGSGGTLGGVVVASRKADFCMIDTRLLWFGVRGNGPRNHHFPQCNVPSGDGAGPSEMRQGIDVGWADVYTWDLPGQFIDVSAVDDGVYAVAIRVNPDGLLRELDPSGNNLSYTRIRIAGTAVSVCPPLPDAC